MKNRYETIEAGDSCQFRAYVSEPSEPNGFAVIVLQEIFGVTKQVRGVVDRFAQDGFLGYAPDLFWRMEPGVELSHSKEDMQKAFSLLERYSDADGLADIASTAKHIRAGTRGVRKVAIAGLCLGGKLAYLGATLPVVDAAVSFYGVGMEKRLDAATHICRPLMMHFAEQDPYVGPAARADLAAALAGRAVETHLYPDADHGFYTRGAQADIDSARARTNAFLRYALGT